MTLAGTRPPLISETNLYELHHRARLAIKPGITGMWQVSGRSDITDFEEVVRLDKEYMMEVCVMFGKMFLYTSGTKRIREIFYRQHIDNRKSYCYSRYNISGKQFFNHSVI